LRRFGLWLCVLLAGCDQPTATVPAQGAGARLERAAIAAGMVPDPDRIDPVGVFGVDGDQVCVVPRTDAGYTIGATVDYGEDQACVGRGSATGRSPLKVDFSEGCRFDAAFDGERITLPAVLPRGCERLCTGRATLAALAAPRLSATAAEAAALRAPDGRLLCSG